MAPPRIEDWRQALIQKAVDRVWERELRGVPRFTAALVLGIVVIHLAVCATDGHLGGGGFVQALAYAPHPATTLAWGARVSERIQQGEGWRLLSCVFLHGGGLHLTLNALSLYALGRLAEAIYGPGRMAGAFLACGLSGSLLSWAFGPLRSVGASGAVFGLLGLAIGFGVRHRRELPPGLSEILVSDLGRMAILNLGIGLLPGIDNHAHIGGLVAGGALAWVMQDKLRPGAKQTAWAGWVGATLFGLGGVYTAIQVWSHLNSIW